jgi:hypothetical protein
LPKKPEENAEMSPAPAPAEPDTLVLASETMAGDIRDFILDRLKHEHQPLPWNMRGEEDQKDTIARVASAVTALVRKAVQAIAADGRKVIKARLAQVTVKDGIKGVVEVMQSDPLRHQLIDATGLDILLVVSDASVFEGTRGDVPIDPDQKGLGIGDEYQDEAA